MYTSKKPYMYGTGRRKSSVARVHLFPNGTGAIKINGRDIDDYFGLETLKLIVRQPLNTTGVIGKVDIDEEPDLAARYGVMSIPTVILFKNGEEAARMVGLQSKQALVRMIEEA